MKVLSWLQLSTVQDVVALLGLDPLQLWQQRPLCSFQNRACDKVVWHTGTVRYKNNLGICHQEFRSIGWCQPSKVRPWNGQWTTDLQSDSWQHAMDLNFCRWYFTKPSESLLVSDKESGPHKPTTWQILKRLQRANYSKWCTRFELLLHSLAVREPHPVTPNNSGTNRNKLVYFYAHLL